MGSQVRLLGPDGYYKSDTKGEFGGHKGSKIYGTMDCSTAQRFLKKGTYQDSRVFFADEATAIACKYHPCGDCLPEKHAKWKEGSLAGLPLGSDEFRWLVYYKPRKR